ncbi:MAG: hypothetical protein NTY48_04290, partial [Candidatus Diapherotrites archaeon]|nr:hypothetical protein [Candidatus Diapherotrites archaeon]
MIKDSYTPQSLKLQILCFYALVIGIIFSAIIPLFFWIVIASIAAHILLGIDLFIMCLKKDKLIAIASPIILFLRSAVFGIGLIVGKLNG